MKIRLLLVDDEQEFTDTLKQRLEIRDFSVNVAYSGEQALSQFNQDETDVIILDVLMPGISGIETLERFKTSAPLVEVIMLTGNATVENAIQGMKKGAYDYLMKPVETELLVEKINEAYKIKHDHEERIRQAEIQRIINHQGW
ncbi:MAG: response regulator [Proteobacteria bacterium]|nr:response regulator [Pseudomonadota bacterium]